MKLYENFEELLCQMASLYPDSTAAYYDDGGVVKRLTFGGLLSAAKKVPVPSEERIGVFSGEGIRPMLNVLACAFAGKKIAMLTPVSNEADVAAQIAAAGSDAIMGDEYKKNYPRSADRGEDGEMLFFTSGTTARSKAVELSQSILCAAAFNGSSMLPLSPKDVLLCVLPLSHVFGFVCGALWAWQCGAAVAFGRGARHLADDLSHFQPTAVSVVPQLLAFYAQHSLFNPELRTVLVGAGGCPKELLQNVAKEGIRVSFGYGLTETGSGAAISIENDPYAMRVCPLNKITIAPDGTVLIASDHCLMRGYRGDSEETKKALAGGVMHTGDLGYFDADGLLHVIGRKDEVLVLPNGTKIFLPEYEEKLKSALGEDELAVTFCGGSLAVTIYTSADSSVLEEKLRAFNVLQERGAQICNIIRATAPLPRTLSGKINRRNLNEQ